MNIVNQGMDEETRQYFERLCDENLRELGSRESTTILGSYSRSSAANGEGLVIDYFEVMDYPFQMTEGKAVAALAQRIIWQDGAIETHLQFLTENGCGKLWQALGDIALKSFVETRPEGYRTWPAMVDWARTVSLAYQNEDFGILEDLTADFLRSFRDIEPEADPEADPEPNVVHRFETVTEEDVRHALDLGWLPPLESGDVITVTSRITSGEFPENEVEFRFERNPPRLKIKGFEEEVKIGQVEGE